MPRLIQSRAAALLLILLGAPHAAAQQLDWEVQEEPAGQPQTALRAVRDGVLGLCDDAADLQIGIFAEVSMLGSAVLMAGSDAIGLLDDNPLSQHLFKGTASKSLAKTAWVLHRSAAEAILGSHGLEKKRYIEAALVELNPLLAGAQSQDRLPLDPLAFVGEGMLHSEVYRNQRPAALLISAVFADAVVRPLGNLYRIVGARKTADRLERMGTELVEEVIE